MKAENFDCGVAGEFRTSTLEPVAETVDGDASAGIDKARIDSRASTKPDMTLRSDAGDVVVARVMLCECGCELGVCAYEEVTRPTCSSVHRARRGKGGSAGL